MIWAEVVVILTALANILDRHWVMLLTRRSQVSTTPTVRTLAERVSEAHDVENSDSITVRPAKKPYAYAEGL